MTLYTLDTSTFITAWNDHYPLDIFPAFWEYLDVLIQEGKVTCIEEVQRELERKDDGVAQWARQRADKLFCLLDQDVQMATREVMARFPALAKQRMNATIADPFVVAVAITKGCQVVTYEKSGSSQRPKIPDVCSAFGVKCYRLVDMMRQEGWRFR